MPSPEDILAGLKRELGYAVQLGKPVGDIKKSIRALDTTPEVETATADLSDTETADAPRSRTRKR